MNFGGFQVEENICKFAKKGLTPSQIGVILRDSHGIAQVKSVTGSKILRILKAHGMLSFSTSQYIYFSFMRTTMMEWEHNTSDCIGLLGLNTHLMVAAFSLVGTWDSIGETLYSSSFPWE